MVNQEPKTNILGVPQEEYEAMMIKAGEESAKEMQKISQNMPEEWEVKHLAETIFSCMRLGQEGSALMHIRKSLALAKSQERELLHQTFVKHFAGAGELWFPYVGVGANTREEEIKEAENEWDGLLYEMNESLQKEET